MKIRRLEYYDADSQWKLEPVDFSDNLNLLVGVSGAGKTSILRAIYSLKKIANGESFNGVEWSICFSIEGNDYYWKGKFETKKYIQLTITEEESNQGFSVLSEHLEKNGETVVERNQEEGIKFNNQQMPKLSSFQSLVDIFSEEEEINIIKEGFNKVVNTNPSGYFNQIFGIPNKVLKNSKNITLAKIKSSKLIVPIKLSLVYKIIPEEFNKIKEIFKEIFSQVEELKFSQFDTVDQEELPLHIDDSLIKTSILEIREKNQENWISQPNISSGMFKTLMYIGELYLAPENSVILIDEFENSLGVNCIDSVTDLILKDTNSQFLITSHHPYIINNIPPAYWKIVTRQGNSVKVKDAEDYHISPSRQKGFIDLINVLEEDDEDESPED